MNYNNLLAIMDFLYIGEANVFQENLDSFLAIAEELQLKGLMGNNAGERVEDLDVAKKYQNPQYLPTFNSEKKALKTSFKKETSGNKIVRAEDNNAVAIPSNYSGDVDQLEAIVRSMMEKSVNNYRDRNRKADRCKVCGKEGMSNAIKDHIEANHIDELSSIATFAEKFSGLEML